jgi:hypothetical protein
LTREDFKSNTTDGNSRRPSIKSNTKMLQGRITAENGSTFTRILEEMLRQNRRPDLITHVNTLGPTEWVTIGNRIMSKNRMVCMVFQTIAGYLTKLEDSPEDWHLSPIGGHSRVHKLFPFHPADHATLETLRITTVSQIFETHLSGRIDKAHVS